MPELAVASTARCESHCFTAIGDNVPEAPSNDTAGRIFDGPCDALYHHGGRKMETTPVNSVG